ncbi:MAG: hypothetical protein JXQ87_13565 [Bacteroidia bacterium]
MKITTQISLLALLALTACSSPTFEEPITKNQRILSLETNDVDDPNNKSYQDFEYREDGRLSKTIRRVGDPVLNSENVYVYDGDLLTETYRYSEALNSKSGYKYYKYTNGQVSEISYTSVIDGEEHYYTYNNFEWSGGKITKYDYRLVRQLGTTYLRTGEYTYSGGNVSEFNLYSTDNGEKELLTSITYEYDNKKNPLQYSYVNDFLQAAVFYSKNNLTKTTQTSLSSNTETLYEQEYTYDGKWPITATNYYNGRASYQTTYVYE